MLDNEVFAGDGTVDIDLGGGFTAIVREDIDYETEQKLTGALARVSLDPETSKPRIGDVDIAGSYVALLKAYLISVKKPDGVLVLITSDNVAKVKRTHGEKIATALRIMRGEQRESKES